MELATIITIICTVVFVGITMSLIEIFKDKKITSEEKQQIQNIVVEVIAHIVKLNQTKDVAQLKDYACSVVMDRLKESNIKATEDTVRGIIDLVLLVQNKLSEKIGDKSVK